MVCTSKSVKSSTSVKRSTTSKTSGYRSSSVDAACRGQTTTTRSSIKKVGGSVGTKGSVKIGSTTSCGTAVSSPQVVVSQVGGEVSAPSVGVCAPSGGVYTTEYVETTSRPSRTRHRFRGRQAASTDAVTISTGGGVNLQDGREYKIVGTITPTGSPDRVRTRSPRRISRTRSTRRATSSTSRVSRRRQELSLPDAGATTETSSTTVVEVPATAVSAPAVSATASTAGGKTTIIHVDGGSVSISPTRAVGGRSYTEDLRTSHNVTSSTSISQERITNIASRTASLNNQLVGFRARSKSPGRRDYPDLDGRGRGGYGSTGYSLSSCTRGPNDPYGPDGTRGPNGPFGSDGTRGPNDPYGPDGPGGDDGGIGPDDDDSPRPKRPRKDNAGYLIGYYFFYGVDDPQRPDGPSGVDTIGNKKPGDVVFPGSRPEHGSVAGNPMCRHSKPRHGNNGTVIGHYYYFALGDPRSPDSPTATGGSSGNQPSGPSSGNQPSGPSGLSTGYVKLYPDRQGPGSRGGVVSKSFGPYGPEGPYGPGVNRLVVFDSKRRPVGYHWFLYGGSDSPNGPQGTGSVDSEGHGPGFPRFDPYTGSIIGYVFWGSAGPRNPDGRPIRCDGIRQPYIGPDGTTSYYIFIRFEKNNPDGPNGPNGPGGRNDPRRPSKPIYGPDGYGFYIFYYDSSSPDGPDVPREFYIVPVNGGRQDGGRPEGNKPDNGSQDGDGGNGGTNVNVINIPSEPVITTDLNFPCCGRPNCNACAIDINAITSGKDKTTIINVDFDDDDESTGGGIDGAILIQKDQEIAQKTATITQISVVLQKTRQELLIKTQECARKDHEMQKIRLALTAIQQQNKNVNINISNEKVEVTRLEEKEVHIQTLQGNFDQLTEDHESLKIEISTVRDELMQITSKYQECLTHNAELVERVSVLEVAEKEFIELERNVIDLQMQLRDMTDIEDHRDELYRKLQAVKEQRDTYIEKGKQVEEERNNFVQSNKTLAAYLADWKKKSESFKYTNQKLKDRIAVLQADKKTLELRIVELQSVKTELTQKISVLEIDNSTLIQDYDVLIDERDSLEAELDDYDVMFEDYENLQTAYCALRLKFVEFSKQKDDVQLIFPQYKAKLSALKKTIKEKDSTIFQLTSEINALKFAVTNVTSEDITKITNITNITDLGSTTVLPPSAPSTTSPKRYVVMFDHSPSGRFPNELSVKEGDIVLVFSDTSNFGVDGFWDVESNGRRGMVNAAYLQEAPEQPTNPAPPIQTTTYMTVVVDYDPTFQSSSARPDLEIPVKRGDTVTVIGDIDPSGYYNVTLNGRQGLVPGNVLKPFTPGTGLIPPPTNITPPQAPSSNPATFIVIQPHNPNIPGVTPIGMGEFVTAPGTPDVFGNITFVRNGQNISIPYANLQLISPPSPIGGSTQIILDGNALPNIPGGSNSTTINYNTETSSVVVAGSSAPLPSTVSQRIYTVIADYDPNTMCVSGRPDRELPLFKGEAVIVVGEVDINGYFTIIKNDHTGLVPGRFLQPMGAGACAPSSIEVIQTKPVQRQYLVLYDYDPYTMGTTDRPDLQHPLTQGEIVMVIGDVDANGYLTCDKNGRSLLIPSNFVEVYTPGMTITPNMSMSAASPGGAHIHIHTHASPSPHHVQAAVSPAANVVVVGADDETGPPYAPRNLTVSRVVTQTALLLDWELPQMDELGRSNGVTVVGYKIWVDGKEKQDVTSATMTKALLDDLDLSVNSIEFSIQSLGANGFRSEMVSYTLVNPIQLLEEEAEESAPIFYCIALYDYDPFKSSPNPNPRLELNLTEGGVIKVLDNSRTDGFYYGECNGVRGLIPSNFVEKCDAPTCEE